MLKRFALFICAILMLGVLAACADSKADGTVGDVSTDTPAQFTEALPESVTQRVYDAIVKGETNIGELFEGGVFDISKLALGNHIPTYHQSNGSLVKNMNMYIPVFYDGEVISSISTGPKTSYEFARDELAAALSESDFTKAVIVYSRGEMYICDGENAVIYSHYAEYDENEPPFVDSNGKITIDCSGLVYCDLTQMHPLTQAK